MATGLFSSKTNRRTTAVAQLPSHSTTWRAIDIYGFNGSWTVFVAIDIKNYIETCNGQKQTAKSIKI